MIDIIKKYLLKIIDNIDAGNSNLTESEAIELVDTLKRLTDREKRLSKYEACRYLNVSRATFDNYVREGNLQSTSGLRMMTTRVVAVKYISTLGEHNKLGGV